MPRVSHTHASWSILGEHQIVLILATILLVGVSATAADEVEGFLKPFREIDAAASESGIISQIDVREGQRVKEGDVLAVLHQDVLRATLEIASKAKDARGQLESAVADLRVKAERLANLEALLKNDHASQEEVDRATGEKDVAEAHVLAAKELIQVKELEYIRIQEQLEERTVRAPIDGVITQMHKDKGESVCPIDAIVLTVVQLDPLLANFSIPSRQASDLAGGRTVQLRIDSAAEPTDGTVEFVSPVVNAKSGTVMIKVRLPNPDGQYRSGEKCTLILP